MNVHMHIPPPPSGCRAHHMPMSPGRLEAQPATGPGGIASAQVGRSMTGARGACCEPASSNVHKPGRPAQDQGDRQRQPPPWRAERPRPGPQRLPSTRISRSGHCRSGYTRMILVLVSLVRHWGQVWLRATCTVMHHHGGHMHTWWVVLMRGHVQEEPTWYHVGSHDTPRATCCNAMQPTACMHAARCGRPLAQQRWRPGGDPSGVHLGFTIGAPKGPGCLATDPEGPSELQLQLRQGIPHSARSFAGRLHACPSAALRIPAPPPPPAQGVKPHPVADALVAVHVPAGVPGGGGGGWDS